MKNTVFVYGTLKFEYSNHVLLSDSKFLGEAMSMDSYLMTASGPVYGIPFVHKQDEISPNLYRHAKPICGEVYEVTDDALADLDRLECHPRWYCREEAIFTFLANGKTVDAWVYFMPWDNIAPDSRIYIIEDGVFNHYSRRSFYDKSTNLVKG